MKFKIILVVFAIGLFGLEANRLLQEETFHTYEEKIPGSEVSFKMVAIEGGTFKMGSATPKKEGETEVKIAPFWMGEHEVTHDEFNLFLHGAENDEEGVDAISRPTPQYIDLTWGMGREGGYPANSMSYYTAMMYCKWLYEKTGNFYRLPTEAEWEYASKAGSETVYPFGDNPEELVSYAWFIANSDEKYHRVKQLKPNAWGLYDMLGNVAEWTLDQYEEEYYKNLKENSDNPHYPVTKTYPISVRGGHFDADAEALRPDARMGSSKGWNMRDPQTPKSKWWLTDAAFVGFRVVRPAEQPTKKEIEEFYHNYLN